MFLDILKENKYLKYSLVLIYLVFLSFCCLFYHVPNIINVYISGT